MKLEDREVDVGHHRRADLRDLAAQHAAGHVLRLGRDAADRQVLDPYVAVPDHAARRGDPLLVAAQVADQADAQLVEPIEVGGRQRLETVGPVDPAPAHAASVGARVAAQVAEVDRAFELEATLARAHGAYGV